VRVPAVLWVGRQSILSLCSPLLPPPFPNDLIFQALVRRSWPKGTEVERMCEDQVCVEIVMLLVKQPDLSSIEMASHGSW
jgi:hypothetical protein